MLVLLSFLGHMAENMLMRLNTEAAKNVYFLAVFRHFS